MSDANGADRRLSRRELLKVGALSGVGVAAAGVAGVAGVTALPALQGTATGPQQGHLPGGGHGGAHGGTHHDMAVVGELRTSDFDPTAFLTHFDTGRVSRLPSGQVLREFELVAEDKEIEVAPGVFYPAWTYNGQVPGPTLRCTEGDRVRVHFTNRGSHPHTVHFHGIHAYGMDGAFEYIGKGQSYTYEFDAEPFGLQLYHCHTVPLKRHLHKGLYGVFIIDPKEGRPPAREMVMMMNAFDTNFDNENEFYAVNTVPFHYQKHPIPLTLGELVRIYLVNITEFDLVNSFHLHGNFFQLYRTGTSLQPHDFTDVVTMGQGERAILEFRYKFPGLFMFHAHQSEFAELGWSGMFNVRGPNV